MKEEKEFKKKSKSQIQRAIIFRIWEESKYRKEVTEEQFYDWIMDKNIDYLKNRLKRVQEGHDWEFNFKKGER